MNNKIELTREEKIKWFFMNYYETGMELGILYQNITDYDLENGIKWYNDIIKFPKYKDENNVYIF